MVDLNMHYSLINETIRGNLVAYIRSEIGGYFCFDNIQKT